MLEDNETLVESVQEEIPQENNSSIENNEPVIPNELENSSPLEPEEDFNGLPPTRKKSSKIKKILPVAVVSLLVLSSALYYVYLFDEDGDGIPNNQDVFPKNSSESKDSDKDGIGDNADALPLDPTETKDSDSDGVGDNSDDFPLDPEMSNDENEFRMATPNVGWKYTYILTSPNLEARISEEVVSNNSDMGGQKVYISKREGEVISQKVGELDVFNGKIIGYEFTPIDSFNSNSIINYDYDYTYQSDSGHIIQLAETEFESGSNTKNVFVIGDTWRRSGTEKTLSKSIIITDSGNASNVSEDEEIQTYDYVCVSYIENFSTSAGNFNVFKLTKTDKHGDTNSIYYSPELKNIVRNENDTTSLDLFSYTLNDVSGVDADNDGVRDEIDDFPNDPDKMFDTDNDGVDDFEDEYIYDASESKDSDNDGYGDNGDVFPDDATEWLDSDGDGYGDNTDAFPNKKSEWVDSDGDGYGDNIDCYDSGNAHFRVRITHVQGDTSDGDGSFNMYFYITIKYNSGEVDVSGTSQVYTSMTLDNPYSLTANIPEDADKVMFIISVKDDGFWSDYIVDYTPDASSTWEPFIPNTSELPLSYTRDGNDDGNSGDLDCRMQFTAEIIGG